MLSFCQYRQVCALQHLLQTAQMWCQSWTDKYQQNKFMSIAVSFVDKNFNIQQYDLCVKDASKHVCLSLAAKAALQVTKSSVAVMIKDSKVLMQHHSGLPHFCCPKHFCLQ